MASEGIQEIAVTDNSIRLLASGHLIAQDVLVPFMFPRRAR